MAEAENIETRAAIAAVERLMRRERENQAREERHIRKASERAEKRRLEKVAEEARVIESIEATRLGTICHYYMGIGRTMSKMHDVQRKAMLDRHRNEKDETQRFEEIRSREQDIETEIDLARANFLRETKRMSQSHRLSFARKVIDATARHREELDEQMQVLKTALGNTKDDELRKAALIEELTGVQQAELAALRAMLNREIEKLNQRAAEFQVPNALLQKQESIRLEKISAREDAIECVDRHAAELSWWSMAVRERQAMLDEDKQRLIKSGAEVPHSASEQRSSLNINNTLGFDFSF